LSKQDARAEVLGRANHPAQGLTGLAHGGNLDSVAPAGLLVVRIERRLVGLLDGVHPVVEVGYRTPTTTTVRASSPS